MSAKRPSAELVAMVNRALEGTGAQVDLEKYGSDFYEPESKPCPACGQPAMRNEKTCGERECDEEGGA